MEVWKKPFFRYVIRGSFNRANAVASAAGAAVLLIVSYVIGIGGKAMLSADESVRSIEIALIGFAIIWLAIMVCRACWWPFHWRLESHGGLVSFLRARLGTFMWPVILTTAGLLAFILLSGVGVIWLALQMLSGVSTPTLSSTPNTVGNPDFVLLPPEGRYKFKWDPVQNPRIDVRLDTNRNSDFTNNAAFILRNKTNTVAYNISVIWKSETATNLEELIKSPKLSKFHFDTDSTGTKFTLFAPEGSFAMPFSYYLDDSPTQIVPVIARNQKFTFRCSSYL